MTNVTNLNAYIARTVATRADDVPQPAAIAQGMAESAGMTASNVVDSLIIRLDQLQGLSKEDRLSALDTFIDKLDEIHSTITVEYME